ncbi:hypothetical protein [Telluribacter sp. SYSU D00476]|uniref:hypothetical protein n=1 Tax=Telluribacter sp. SYSU D00476 TaxID=2811430 RepID=UPI001FF0FE7A|nr:hypothetical protein [Telluribacter sp. SYSU D00476]
MKAKSIRFFSPVDNSEEKQKSTSKAPELTGYISGTGKLVFPNKTVEQLDFNPEETRFMIGAQEGKRKIKSLFLVPSTDDQAEAFELTKSTKNYNIPLAFILQKNGVDYSNNKYNFTVKPFDYEGLTGYELQLEQEGPKPEYTGKPRGRKPKNAQESQA